MESLWCVICSSEGSAEGGGEMWVVELKRLGLSARQEHKPCHASETKWITDRHNQSMAQSRKGVVGLRLVGH